VDGHTYHETWFVDCKHYKRGVPPAALQGLLTWAEAEHPDVVLVIASCGCVVPQPCRDAVQSTDLIGPALRQKRAVSAGSERKYSRTSQTAASGGRVRARTTSLSSCRSASVIAILGRSGSPAASHGSLAPTADLRNPRS
jgi:hypothetical protein